MSVEYLQLTTGDQGQRHGDTKGQGRGRPSTQDSVQHSYYCYRHLGIWALVQFVLTDATASNIQADVSTEALNYSADSKLLVIHFKMKNIGRVPVQPDHLTVTVRDIPEGLKLGGINVEKLKQRYAEDVRKRYPKAVDGYTLEPG